MGRIGLALILTGLLTGATAAFAEDVTRGTDVESGTSPNAAVGERRSGTSGSSAGNNPQTCSDECNRTYENCMDEQSSIPGNGDSLRYSNNAADKMIGGSADCSDHLRSCMNGCGG
jgi:hypothetical protein